MSHRVYRVCRSVHARLDGEGAKLVGARWNSPGHAVVYMASSVSLAVLENLVHMTRDDFPVGYVLVSALIPDDVKIMNQDDIRQDLASADPRQLGDYWVRSLRSAVLRVPSAVVVNEFNYLLNPRHSEFDRILTDPPRPFFFDDRLFGSGRKIK